MKLVTKKLLISSLSLGMVVLCCTGAFATVYIDAPCSETVSYVQSIEQKAETISVIDAFNLDNTRATNRLDITIDAGKLLKADTPFSLEVGEIVKLNFIYSPQNASPQVGLVGPDGVFRYVSGANGSIQKNIIISKTGNYYLAFQNNALALPATTRFSLNFLTSQNRYKQRTAQLLLSEIR